MTDNRPQFEDSPDTADDSQASASSVFMALMRKAASDLETRQAAEAQARAIQQDARDAMHAGRQARLAGLSKAPSEAAVSIDTAEPPPIIAPSQALTHDTHTPDDDRTQEQDALVLDDADPQDHALSQPDSDPDPSYADIDKAIPQISPQERAHLAALAAQRQQREDRRRTRKQRAAVSGLGGAVVTLFSVVVAGALLATILTWFTDPTYLSTAARSGLQVAQATSGIGLTPIASPTPMSTPNWLRRVGIVSGHRGPQNDPGAVCPDGFTEASINFGVAQLVVRSLRERGYSVDLLDEFDPRLSTEGGYQAAALLSIHANTCQTWPGGEVVSGFLIASAAARANMGGLDPVLVECVAQAYGAATNLQRRTGVTVDMTDYHNFREIHPLTPAAIIELGFMLADRPLLEGQQPLMAQAITEGLICFLEPQARARMMPTDTPTP
jgi:N-acetylmuramoyl-L-alanine amidase